MERRDAQAQERILAAITQADRLLGAAVERPSARERIVVELGPVQARRVLRAVAVARAGADDELDALLAA